MHSELTLNQCGKRASLNHLEQHEPPGKAAVLSLTGLLVATEEPNCLRHPDLNGAKCGI